MGKIPVSVLVVTKNEERAIGRCLRSLSNFDDVMVIDSCSSDRTVEISRGMGTRVEEFSWNGQYPKKRQWCLEHLVTKYARVLFVDADEVVPPELEAEIRALEWTHDGYFVHGRYVMGDKALRFGMMNNKLCLFDKSKFMFPVVDDLDLPGMGEIEGHYQPVAKDNRASVGCLKNPVLHYAMGNMDAWERRHERYARWEAGMIARGAYPKDPVEWRKRLKNIFRTMPLRPWAAFVHSYVLKLGFMDGRNGLKMAGSRYRYYRMVSDFSRQYKDGAQDFSLKESA